jgi:hypothetical protein
MANPDTTRESMLSQPIKQCMLGVRRLLIRVPDLVTVAVPIDCRPAAVMNLNAPTFDLENEQTPLGMDHDEIGFTISLPAAPSRLPADVVKHDPMVGQFAERISNPSFGIL